MHKGYVAAGIFTLLASLPGWAVLLRVWVPERTAPTLLLGLPGGPAGALLVGFGMGWLPRNRRSGAAVRFAVLGLGFAVCLYGSLIAVRLGAVAFLTAVMFSGMAYSYLALVTLAFLLAALIRKHAETR